MIRIGKDYEIGMYVGQLRDIRNVKSPQRNVLCTQSVQKSRDNFFIEEYIDLK